MNVAEIKLDLFRRLDSLDAKKLELIYEQIVTVINSKPQKKNELAPEIKKAIDEALIASEQKRVHTHSNVMKITKSKYPHLFS